MKPPASFWAILVAAAAMVAVLGVILDGASGEDLRQVGGAAGVLALLALTVAGTLVLKEAA